MMRTALDTGLPRLGWVAQADRGIVTVSHGSWVEVGQDFVVEGVWPGDFARGDFDNASAFFGTGMRLRGDRIVFVPSLGATDPLYYAERRQTLWVSNSLPVLLFALGDALDPRCFDYHHINASMVEGIDGYHPELPTVGGAVKRLLYRNLVHADGRIEEAEKPWPPKFPDFATYRQYFSTTIADLVANARSPIRRAPFDLFSTQSSGFDSTAVNAIVAPHGPERVFTNRHGKAPGRFANADASRQVTDDGGPICEALGLTPTHIDRRAFESGISDELGYLSAIAENGEYNLDPILQFIERPTVVFSGQYGEVWRPAEIDKAGQLDGAFKRHDLGGQGWSEIRLEAGFVHVPAPFIGARRRAEISRISGSAEMRPWRSGNEYDKPIPARIAVEAGVPRYLFGQAKKAAAVQFCPPRVPRGKALRDQYFDYLTRQRLLPAGATRLFPLVHGVNAYISFHSPRRYRAIYYFGRVLTRLRRRETTVPLIWDRLSGTIFCFAVNARIDALVKRCTPLDRLETRAVSMSEAGDGGTA